MTAALCSWPAMEAALDGMLSRRWYTNQGPMAQALERELERRAEFEHAVAVTNPTIALIMLLEGLDVRGSVLVPALAPLAFAQAVRWAGLRPMFCDIDETRLITTVGSVRATAGRVGRCEALMLSPAADITGLRAFAAATGLMSCGEGFGVAGHVTMRLAGHGDEAGAACVLTDDARLAARLRNIRSSYGAGPAVPVVRTANGRVSEAQAAMALLALPERFKPCNPLTYIDGRPMLMVGRQPCILFESPAEAALAREGCVGHQGIDQAIAAPEGACPIADRIVKRAVPINAMETAHANLQPA